MRKDKALTEKRNAKICERYKELYHKQKLQHTKCLEMLTEEFFLSAQTLSLIILNGKKEKKPLAETLQPNN